MIDLAVQVGKLRWPTPIGLASGTCGYGSELDGLVDWSAVGAIFTKGLSLKPRTGNAPPRIWETPSGMLNAIGLENIGVEAFISDKMPFLRSLRASLIPIVTFLGIEIGNLMGGAIITEGIFNVPGIGFQLKKAIDIEDGPTVVSIVSVLVVVYLLANLVVDVLYAVLDPRIRYE